MQRAKWFPHQQAGSMLASVMVFLVPLRWRSFFCSHRVTSQRATSHSGWRMKSWKYIHAYRHAHRQTQQSPSNLICFLCSPFLILYCFSSSSREGCVLCVGGLGPTERHLAGRTDGRANGRASERGPGGKPASQPSSQPLKKSPRELERPRQGCGKLAEKRRTNSLAPSPQLATGAAGRSRGAMTARGTGAAAARTTPTNSKRLSSVSLELFSKSMFSSTNVRKDERTKRRMNRRASAEETEEQKEQRMGHEFNPLAMPSCVAASCITVTGDATTRRDETMHGSG